MVTKKDILKYLVKQNSDRLESIYRYIEVILIERELKKDIKKD